MSDTLVFPSVVILTHSIRHNILPRSESILGAINSLGLPSDDEEDFDLLWSDDEDTDHKP